MIETAPVSENKGTIINGETINNIRFANDNVIISRFTEELQDLLHKTSRYPLRAIRAEINEKIRTRIFQNLVL